jgi:hypothetical protein
MGNFALRNGTDSSFRRKAHFREPSVMRSNPGFGRLSVINRSFMSFWAASLVALVFHANVFAATPVDVYQSMESGSDGDLLASTLVNGSSYPSGKGWSLSSGADLRVSNKYARDLPSPVLVGGVTYPGTNSTRTWMYNCNNAKHYASLALPGSGHPNITIACYYTTETTVRNTNQYDTIIMWGQKTFAVMQNVNDDGKGPYLRAHSCKDPGHATTFSPAQIKVVPGKTYWVNLKYDAIAAKVYLAAFDPDNRFAQVGTTVAADSCYADAIYGHLDFGRADSHHDNPRDTKQSWFGQILVDYTNGAFPLLPNSTDATPPATPGAVRDGIGAGAATTPSTVWLSANWDPSTDWESGILGYQYAIGATQGGTDVVNWTSIPNVTAYTKTGLNLTAGQTYYFSVKAVNGAGLVGSAASSNGQMVLSPAPVTYFQDNFESWTAPGGAWSSVSGQSGGNSLDTSADRSASGAKSLKIVSAAGGSRGACLTKNFSPNFKNPAILFGDLYVRFYVFIPTGFEAANPLTRLMSVLPGTYGTYDNGACFARVTLMNSKVELELQGNWHGTSAFASGQSLSENQWHCIEIHLGPITPHTLMECWIDGVKNSTTLTYDLSYATSYDQLLLGDFARGSSNAGGTFYLDDAVVSNSYIGPLPADATLPSAPPTVTRSTRRT